MKIDTIDNFDMSKPFPKVKELHHVIYQKISETFDPVELEYLRSYKRFCARKQAMRQVRKDWSKQYHLQYYLENKERILQHMKDTYVYEKKGTRCDLRPAQRDTRQSELDLKNQT